MGRVLERSRGRARAVADRFDGGGQRLGTDVLVADDGRLLGREVDRGVHAVQRVEGPLDAGRARGAGHAFEVEADSRVVVSRRRWHVDSLYPPGVSGDFESRVLLAPGRCHHQGMDGALFGRELEMSVPTEMLTDPA